MKVLTLSSGSLFFAFLVTTKAALGVALPQRPFQLHLEDAVAEARQKNPLLMKAEAAKSGASWKKLEALSGHLPKISASATHFFDLQYQLLDVNFGGGPVTFPAVYPKTLLGLDVSWNLFDGGQTYHSYKGALKGQEAADFEYTRAELQLETEIESRFYQVIAARQLQIVADQNLKTLEDHLEKSKARLKQGQTTKFDLLRVQVQLEEAVPEKASADDNTAIARIALSQVMGAGPGAGTGEDPRIVVGDLPVPDEATLSKVKTINPEDRADYQALIKLSEAAEDAHSASMGTWFPRVTLIGQEQLYNSQDFSFSSPFRNAYSVGVAASWNIFDGGASIARQKESYFAQVQAENLVRAAALRAPVDFELWRRKYLYNTSLYRARKRSLESAEESVRLAQLGYGAGTRTNTDILDAELDLFRARAGVVRAQLDAAEALINLELAIGKKITS